MFILLVRPYGHCGRCRRYNGWPESKVGILHDFVSTYLDLIKFWPEAWPLSDLKERFLFLSISALYSLYWLSAIGQYLLAHNLEEPDQEAAGTAGGVANDIPVPWGPTCAHEFENGDVG